MQLVRNHGEGVSAYMAEAKNIYCLGWNYRMTELEGAVGIAQFRKLKRLTDHRVSLASYLTNKLKRFPGLILPKTRPQCDHVCFVYAIRFDSRQAGISRDLFIKALTAEGIP